MGKIRTRIIGLEDVEEKQKKEQKLRSAEKKSAVAKAKADKHKIRAQGLKGGERMAEVEVKDKDLEKMEKAKKILEEKPHSAEAPRGKAKKVKIHQRGKNYKDAKKKIEQYGKKLEVSVKLLTLDAAIKLLKEIKFTKFDESVELHINIDETGLKGMVEFPHSTGKKFRVKIVDDKVMQDIEKGKFDFDILVTHPSYMPRLAKFAKILGPKGLMPNPKAGTISPKPEEVVKKYEAGVLRWKTEPKQPVIHQMIGKISLDDKKLIENAMALFNAVGKSHIQKAFIKSTMSPSLLIDFEKELD